MYRLIDYGAMVSDRRRIDAYTRALSAAVTPRSVVLDLGTGIGTFSVIAARLGAARVYAVDAGDVITVAADVGRVNDVADRIRYIQARATELELPEQVDVIVSDLSGAIPLYEEHIPAVMHVRDRFLKPGGALIPARDRLMCAPLSSPELYARIVEPWGAVPEIDLGPAKTMALHAAYALHVEPHHLAAEPRCWATLDYARIASPDVSALVEWPIASEIHGIALWFESTLGDGIASSSGPWSGGSVHATMVLPLLQPVRGETLRMTIGMTLASGRYVVTWQVSTERQAGPRQSTFLSEPRSADSLTERVATPVPDAAVAVGYRVAEQVLCRRVGDEALLFDPASGIYHVLNETGARVWDRLARGDGVEAIAAAVAAEYEVDAARAADDVAAVVARLQEAELIAPC